MQNVRPAAVAGQFYTGSAEELHAQVQGYLADDDLRSTGPCPKAVIAPHAGFAYSGPVAASAFRSLVPDATSIRRIILLGPAHRLHVRGLALSGQDAFATPLGVVPVDRELVEIISGLPQVSINQAAHAPEHCLEVELPFLQTLLASFSILPLLISDASLTEVAEVLDSVWGGPETRIVISSDLSHYLSYSAAEELDRETSQQVLTFRSDIETYRACGAGAINGFLAAARQRDLTPRVLDLRNSGDTAGDRMRVVGYGAFSFVAPS